MDWQALTLSLKLAAITLLVLLPIGLWLGRWLAYQQFKGKALVEALVVLPLVLPPTVLGYYLLVSLGGASPLAGCGNTERKKWGIAPQQRVVEPEFHHLEI